VPLRAIHTERRPFVPLRAIHTERRPFVSLRAIHTERRPFVPLRAILVARRDTTKPAGDKIARLTAMLELKPVGMDHLEWISISSTPFSKSSA
jgi:hypothetical protein